MTLWPNKITGANAGGPHQLPVRTLWAARIAQFCRSLILLREHEELNG